MEGLKAQLKVNELSTLAGKSAEYQLSRLQLDAEYGRMCQKDVNIHKDYYTIRLYGDLLG